MARPPFADAAAYAAALAELVPDTKGARDDADLIADALDAYTQRFPRWMTADIGDGTTYEWELGKSGEAFEDFALGFSDHFPLEIEELDSSDAPIRPRLSIHKGWSVDQRIDGSGDAVLVLVFESSPASTAKMRVRWRMPWVLAKVPVHHQMGLVYLAARDKAQTLASYYRKTIDAGSDVFDGAIPADGYEREARKWESRANRILGIGQSMPLSRARCKPNRQRVFHRRIP